MATTSIDYTNIVFDNAVPNDITKEQLIAKYNLNNPVQYNNFDDFYEMLSETDIICSFNDANLNFSYALIDDDEKCVIVFDLV